jgi:hypothetical protein
MISLSYNNNTLSALGGLTPGEEGARVLPKHFWSLDNNEKKTFFGK